MKFSKETVDLLKNFASINGNLVLKQGNKLATISGQKNVMAEVTIAEQIPQNFGIYDLNEFVGLMTTFDDPELSFSGQYVSFDKDDNHVKFYAADESILVAPTKTITFPEVIDAEFKLSADNLQTIRKIASVLGSTDVSFVGDGEKITAIVNDKKNSTSNAYNTTIGTTDKTFKANVKVENIKMLPGDYIVSLSSRKISRFKAGTGDLVYYVAIEADSTF